MSFTEIENKHHVCKGKDCLKKFCGCLKNHARKVINFKKNKMEFLTNEESYENAKIYFICKKKIKISMLKIINIGKIERSLSLFW